eukprot:PhM_4_TR12926/c0_g1_i1/m.2534
MLRSPHDNDNNDEDEIESLQFDDDVESVQHVPLFSAQSFWGGEDDQESFSLPPTPQNIGSGAELTRKLSQQQQRASFRAAAAGRTAKFVTPDEQEAPSMMPRRTSSIKRTTTTFENIIRRLSHAPSASNLARLQDLSTTVTPSRSSSIRRTSLGAQGGGSGSTPKLPPRRKSTNIEIEGANDQVSVPIAASMRSLVVETCELSEAISALNSAFTGEEEEEGHDDDNNTVLGRATALVRRFQNNKDVLVAFVQMLRRADPTDEELMTSGAGGGPSAGLLDTDDYLSFLRAKLNSPFVTDALWGYMDDRLLRGVILDRIVCGRFKSSAQLTPMTDFVQLFCIGVNNEAEGEEEENEPSQIKKSATVFMRDNRALQDALLSHLKRFGADYQTTQSPDALDAIVHLTSLLALLLSDSPSVAVVDAVLCACLKASGPQQDVLAASSLAWIRRWSDIEGAISLGSATVVSSLLQYAALSLRPVCYEACVYLNAVPFSSSRSSSSSSRCLIACDVPALLAQCLLHHRLDVPLAHMLVAALGALAAGATWRRICCGGAGGVTCVQGLVSALQVFSVVLGPDDVEEKCTPIFDGLREIASTHAVFLETSASVVSVMVDLVAAGVVQDEAVRLLLTMARAGLDNASSSNTTTINHPGSSSGVVNSSSINVVLSSLCGYADVLCSWAMEDVGETRTMLLWLVVEVMILLDVPAAVSATQRETIFTAARQRMKADVNADDDNNSTSYHSDAAMVLMVLTTTNLDLALHEVLQYSEKRPHQHSHSVGVALAVLASISWQEEEAWRAQLDTDKRSVILAKMRSAVTHSAPPFPAIIHGFVDRIYTMLHGFEAHVESAASHMVSLIVSCEERQRRAYYEEELEAWESRLQWHARFVQQIAVLKKLTAQKQKAVLKKEKGVGTDEPTTTPKQLTVMVTESCFSVEPSVKSEADADTQTPPPPAPPVLTSTPIHCVASFESPASVPLVVSPTTTVFTSTPVDLLSSPVCMFMESTLGDDTDGESLGDAPVSPSRQNINISSATSPRVSSYRRSRQQTNSRGGDRENTRRGSVTSNVSSSCLGSTLSELSLVVPTGTLRSYDRDGTGVPVQIFRQTRDLGFSVARHWMQACLRALTALHHETQRELFERTKICLDLLETQSSQRDMLRVIETLMFRVMMRDHAATSYRLSRPDIKWKRVLYHTVFSLKEWDGDGDDDDGVKEAAARRGGAERSPRRHQEALSPKPVPTPPTSSSTSKRRMKTPCSRATGGGCCGAENPDPDPPVSREMRQARIVTALRTHFMGAMHDERRMFAADRAHLLLVLSKKDTELQMARQLIAELGGQQQHQQQQQQIK